MIADANFTILELANILRQVLTTGAYEGQRHVGQGVPIPTIGLATWCNTLSGALRLTKSILGTFKLTQD